MLKAAVSPVLLCRGFAKGCERPMIFWVLMRCYTVSQPDQGWVGHHLEAPSAGQGEAQIFQVEAEPFPATRERREEEESAAKMFSNMVE